MLQCSADDTGTTALAARPRGLGRSARALLEAIGVRMVERATAPTRWTDPRKGPHLHSIVRAFLAGYRAACQERDTDRLMARLASVTPWLRGFAYEGAAMPLVLLDAVDPWRRDRFDRLLSAAPHHRYLLYVGAGWGLAQAGRLQGRLFHRLDPLLRWLTIDAAGFRDGFMGGAPQQSDPRRRRRPLPTAAARVFDQGLGRSLWFTTEANPSRIAEVIGTLATPRRADFWSGVGLACAYAGGIDAAEIGVLADVSGPYRDHLAQGAAFAAEARVCSGDPVPAHTEQACAAICGMTAKRAAQAVREAEIHSRDEAGPLCYETWRTEVRRSCAGRSLPEVQLR
jgi:enediyne biosynthesis protein E3